MARIIGKLVALGVTLTASTGIATLIAYEFLGDDGLRAVWNAVVGVVTAPTHAAADDEFKPEKEIHFFEEVEVAGTDYSVVTGGAYSSVGAVEANKPRRQWCYINVASSKPGILARIELGSQDGDAATPSLARKESLAAAGLDAGVTAERLVELAHTHCRFGKLQPLG